MKPTLFILLLFAFSGLKAQVDARLFQHPDIEVKEDPTALAKGIDTQLEKAIETVMKQVKEKGPIHPEEHAKEDRSKNKKVIKP